MEGPSKFEIICTMFARKHSHLALIAAEKAIFLTYRQTKFESGVKRRFGTKNIKDKKQYSERRKLILRVHKSLFLESAKGGSVRYLNRVVCWESNVFSV